VVEMQFKIKLGQHLLLKNQSVTAYGFDYDVS
jgi:hypothetical protein